MLYTHLNKKQQKVAMTYIDLFVGIDKTKFTYSACTSERPKKIDVCIPYIKLGKIVLVGKDEESLINELIGNCEYSKIKPLVKILEQMIKNFTFTYYTE